MPIIAFTDIAIRQLSEGLYFDSKTPAFGLRVGKNRRTWMVLKEPNRTKLRIGHYPALSLADARKKALIALGQEAPEVRSSIKFDVALEEFLPDHYRDKSPRSTQEARRLLTSHFTSFKGRALSDLTDFDIDHELSKMAKTPSEQLHAFRALRVFFKWCMRPPHRYIKHSPLESYPAPSKDRKGSRILSDAELKKIWRACDDMDFFGDIIRLLILWGCRNAEVGHSLRKWREKAVFTVPGTHTKNGRAHAVPILPMARAILDRRERTGHNSGETTYYFPGHVKGSHFNDGSWGKLKKELDKRSGVTGWQVRDLRRTFRSTLARLKVPREIAEIMLNHVTGGGKTDLDEIYDKYTYLPEKRAALQKLETHLKKILR